MLIFQIRIRTVPSNVTNTNQLKKYGSSILITSIVNNLTYFKLADLLPLWFNQHPIHNRNPLLWKLRQQFLDHDHKRRIIIPTPEQELKPRILLRIRRNFDFLHRFQSHI
jgi:hypothetical protein